MAYPCKTIEISKVILTKIWISVTIKLKAWGWPVWPKHVAWYNYQTNKGVLTEWFYTKLLQHIGMNNYNLLASQAQLINRYKNTRSKLQKCCANIYFNKQCILKQITPTYVNIRISNTSPAALVTTKKAQTIRIKDEIKFLYKKKKN